RRSFNGSDDRQLDQNHTVIAGYSVAERTADAKRRRAIEKDCRTRRWILCRLPCRCSSSFIAGGLVVGASRWTGRGSTFICTPKLQVANVIAPVPSLRLIPKYRRYQGPIVSPPRFWCDCLSCPLSIVMRD